MQRQSLCTWKTLTAISMRPMHDVASALRALRSSTSLPALTSWYRITASRISLRQLSSCRNAALTSSGSDAESSHPYRNWNTISRTLTRSSFTLSHSPLHALTACETRCGLAQQSHSKTTAHLDDRDGCSRQSCQYLDVRHLVQHLANVLHDLKNHSRIGCLVLRQGAGKVIVIWRVLGSRSLSIGERLGGGGGAFVQLQNWTLTI